MPEIEKIEDAYVDDVIKSSAVYNPNSKVTQGVRLRELVKLLRDRSEQQETKVIDQVTQLGSAQTTINTDLQNQLNSKVNQQTGWGLSEENFTALEKNKLANLAEHYKGVYISFSALATASPTNQAGDYAFVDAGNAQDVQMYIWDTDDSKWVLSSGSGDISDATETSSGLIAIASLAQALTRSDDQRAMTALKTNALILDEKKRVSYQINPVGVNEVSVLMENAGQVNAVLVAGANSVKLKIGISGSYPVGDQSYPFNYQAGDRVFITYNYTDLLNSNCNIKLKCQDN